MRAVQVSEHGGPEMLQVTDVPVAEPGPGQLLVEVAAAGVNFADIYAREGRLPVRLAQLPFVLGQEGAGTVIAAGAGTEFAPGDRVAWTEAAGCYSEQVLVAAASAVPVPDGIELGTAAAVLLQGMTAHYLCYSTYPVAQDDPVVVHAAAGGVGLLLTQTGRDARRHRAWRPHPARTKRCWPSRRAPTSWPATRTSARWSGEVTGGRGAAVVYDGVGQATFEASLAALRRRGYLVLYGAASGPVPPFDLQRLNPAGSPVRHPADAGALRGHPGRTAVAGR